MFPSGNYFREIPCPFFSRVTCPRPHCHFKHATSSTSNATVTSTSLLIPSDANETLNKLITQLSSAAGNNMSQSVTPSIAPSPTVDLTSIFHSTLLQSLTAAFATAFNAAPQPVVASSNPQDVSEKLTQTISEIATKLNPQQTQAVATTGITKKDTVPEYRPTPIAELERRKRVKQVNSSMQIKSETVELDSDPYIGAIFSPPSTSESNVSSSVSKIKSTETTHSWVTPPARRTPSSSSSDHYDVDDRKATTLQKRTTASTKVVNPSKKVEISRSLSSSVNPTLNRIPKKSSTSKPRLADIDLDRVPLTSTISLDVNTDDEQPVPVKRSSTSEINENVQKKPKLSSTVIGITTKTVINPAKRVKVDDKDEELALFDLAFTPLTSSESKIVPKKNNVPTPVQQLTTRYTTASNSTTSLINKHTRAETSTDGRRIAHQPKNPTQPTANVPLQPLIDPGSISLKIPLKTRQEYLNFFLGELKKLPTSTLPIGTRAQAMEKEVFDKSTNKNTYLNLAARCVRQIRSGQTKKSEENSPKKVPSQRMIVSHSTMLTGGQPINDSLSIRKSKQVDLKMFTENDIYTLMAVYRATGQDLVDNGYPAFSLDFPDKVLIKNQNPVYKSTVKFISPDPTVRLCCRCGKNYRVSQYGEYLVAEECIYHWGRIRPQRVAGYIEKKYSCCQSNFDGVGCAVSKYHVHDGDNTRLLEGYVKTEPIRKSLAANESYGIYAVDCEMCYTINGLELVRVSVVNHKLETVIDTLVRPANEILDYNTRWSGIHEKDLENCHLRLEDVQQRLLKLFNEKTILIGHSLESDLKAMKIVHDTVIDTSLVFPHAKGKPYKRALKTLASEHLNKIIQENADGHNPIEDATVCMELMLLKIKEDLKSATAQR